MDGKKPARGWAFERKERLHQDLCSGFQEQDPSSFRLGGCAHSPQYHANGQPGGRAHKAPGLTKVPGSVVPRMPDRDQRTSLGVTGMLRTQDVSTGCIS